ncbi:hypothetical protein CH72_1643 [Burkholderia ambifaria AMMD]|jgi:hypothetical protein|uniref:Uncharacterized protein n=1 Tax=Burkholderia ambifaria (strain ATCC BAA-244 / DSM 16087 / CCUG 44356 / LMG 19182 / AMMD) TaxID=339670 RepID=Q0BAX1_BURCM|nr:hypothetical protein [Burkholderia ambifaria]ABI88702.1 hypothetical protein Bamb_3146 [Burkholderia ambifaria AMMD]AJY21520.1 hypothetical protein CH72_1643 [Burkholderia ambifaria AMMD]MBR7935075.1 hypothetical protein [Burkholderia ambifaria]QQC04130.1 hypothetical protein I6H84_15500 [Burkholderia ambifaria]UZU05095.1 hypothetical protein OR987_33270 [Burkholderia ambifaria]
MNPGSIENWFEVPPPRAASYLPGPYGVRHGVTDRFARSSSGAVYLSSRRFVIAADVCAADFGHDNLAWSRQPLQRGRGRSRLVLSAIGGALVGAALMALLGGMMAVCGAELGHPARGGLAAGKRASASVVAAAHEAVPVPPATPVSDSALALVPPSAPTASHADALPDPVRVASGHPASALQPTPLRRPDRTGVRARERGTGRSISAKATLRRVPGQPPRVAPAEPSVPSVSGAPDRCGADWPCGDALRALQVELKHREASKPIPAAVQSNAAQTSVRLTDHRRVTEW